MDNGVEALEGFNLTPFQKDALNELGNIASSHAITSLAEMTGMTVGMEVPNVNVVKVEEVKKRLEEEKIVAGILIGLEGSFTGYMQILFPERSAFAMIDLLMGKMPGETAGIESDMEESALMEIGNILASAFCDAIADFLQFSLLPSPPSFAFDMAGAVVENALIALVADARENQNVILFQCDFMDESGLGISGYIMLYPQQESLKNILGMLEGFVT